MNRRTDPASWLREQDSAMRTMLAEMVTFAGKMSEEWNHAIQSADDPDVAMTHLANVEVNAEHLVGFRARLLWRTARKAMRLYDAVETQVRQRGKLGLGAGHHHKESAPGGLV